MYELKSKKSGLPAEVLSDEEFMAIVEADKTRRVKLLERFTVTHIKKNPIIPAFKTISELKEIKPEKDKVKQTKKQNEG